jgi:hypothetical protein
MHLTKVVPSVTVTLGRERLSDEEDEQTQAQTDAEEGRHAGANDDDRGPTATVDLLQELLDDLPTSIRLCARRRRRTASEL